MTTATLARAITGAGLALTLAGCVDVAVDVDLTSPSTAEAILTQVMTADFYAMKGMSTNEAQSNPADAFCPEGELDENPDGSATCTLVEAGPFAELDLGQQDGGITFTQAGPGLVRIALSTAVLADEVSAGEALDAEMQQVIEAFFSGRNFTLRFSGAEVLDTNMELAGNSKSASRSFALVDLIGGKADLPDELFAVVRAP